MTTHDMPNTCDRNDPSIHRPCGRHASWRYVITAPSGTVSTGFVCGRHRRAVARRDGAVITPVGDDKAAR